VRSGRKLHDQIGSDATGVYPADHRARDTKPSTTAEEVRGSFDLKVSSFQMMLWSVHCGGALSGLTSCTTVAFRLTQAAYKGLTGSTVPNSLRLSYIYRDALTTFSTTKDEKVHEVARPV